MEDNMPAAGCIWGLLFSLGLWFIIIGIILIAMAII